MADLYSRVAQLSPQQRQRLARILNQRFSSPSQAGAPESAVAVDRRLVAYVTCRQEDGNSASELRTYVRGRLPDFMTPSSFVLLDDLPRTPNGKVDRLSLAESFTDESLETESAMAPQDDLERELLDIWGTLLGIDSVRVTDDFFDLGGHSLISIRLLAQIEDRLSVRLAASDLFQEPTVRHAAELVRRSRASDAERSSEQAAPSSEVKQVLRDGQSPRPADYSLSQRFVGRMLFTGPLFGKRALPYRIGVRLQRQCVKLPAMQREFASRSVYLHRWFDAIGLSGPSAEQFELFLLANTWRRWRDACLMQSSVFKSWVEFSGAESVRKARDESQPIVFASPHVGIGPLATRLVIRIVTGEDAYFLGKTERGAVGAAIELQQAVDTLRGSGCAFISGDGNQGVEGVTVPLYGRPWTFRSGAAELAVQGNASLIPVYPRLRNDGTIIVEFGQPLCADRSAGGSAVGELTRQYAHCYVERWPEMLPNMKWHNLRGMYGESRADSHD